MARVLFSFLFALCFSAAISQVNWAFAVNGWSNINAKKVAVDVFGDKIITGDYDYNSSDFDPSPGTYNLAINGWGGTDVFIAKYDAGNYLQWAIDMGGSNDDFVHGMITDGQGNIYVCGSFETEILFTPTDTAAGHYYASNNTHGFVAKYDKNGIFKHAIILDGGESFCYGITLDPLNNIYVTGKFSNTVDFNSDTSSAANKTANGGSDIFVAKYDSAGNFSWVFNIGSNDGWYGYNYNEAAHDIQYHSGFLYLTGAFVGINTEFNPNPGVSHKLTSEGQTDPFVAKYDILGNIQWTANIKGTYYSEASYDLDVDNAGSVYITGTIYGTADFAPGSDTAWFTTNGGNDVFISKYDVNGNFKKAVLGGGVNFDHIGYGIDVNNSGEVFITGTHIGPCDYDPASGEYTVGNSNLYGQIFIAGYDTAFNFRWAGDMGLTGYTFYNKDIGYGLCAKDDGSFYVCGSFLGNCDFDPTPTGSYLVQSNGNTNAFLAYYNGNDFWWVGEKENSFAENEIMLYPNPAHSILFLQAKNNFRQIAIKDLNGRTVLRTSADDKKSIAINIEALPAGIYFVDISGANGVVCRKKFIAN